MILKRQLLATGLTASTLLLCTAANAQETNVTEEEPQATEAVAEYSAETVVATVGDTEITLGEIALLSQMLPDQYKQLPDETLIEGIVEQLVDQTLLAEEAGSEDDWSQRLKLQVELERKAVLARTTVDTEMAKPVDEKQVQAAYNEAIGSLPAETEYSASHILVETEEKAKELKETIENGADFADTAKAESTGPSGPNGGSLGWFGAGAMVPEFDSVVTTMEVGTVSEPVQTQFGWHIIQLNETREKAKPTLEETRAEFENQIRQQRLQEQLEALRSEAQVNIDLDAVPASAIRDITIFDQ
ncbi:peptidylprolyl isomerase [Algicella marina]|uniref:Parvulin-like PPIase n=1 Tax=Algicella marina TaxID=2683284 RepID=A0A6P1T571_9RHOB|nr:peptidylprolyl isomerase [Algicella marina]QHQ36921.1 peptidylprolyl isomerase [Algicella marina]